MGDAALLGAAHGGAAAEDLLMLFRRLSFEQGFAPLCRLNRVGSLKKNLGIEALGNGAGLRPALLVYWCIGYWESRLATLHTVPRSHGLTFLFLTPHFRV